MSEVEELRRLGKAVITAWERVGKCEDEFPPDADPGACGEYREALDAAILKLGTAIADHALMQATCHCGRPAVPQKANCQACLEFDTENDCIGFRDYVGE